jgi:hypothetical protein
VRNLSGDKVLDLLSGCLGARAENYEGDGNLARIGVRPPHAGGIGDGRVGEEERLEFGGWNLETVVLDEFLESIDDE